jgi:hypothetical protein
VGGRTSSVTDRSLQPREVRITATAPAIIEGWLDGASALKSDVLVEANLVRSADIDGIGGGCKERAVGHDSFLKSTPCIIRFIGEMSFHSKH